MCLLSLRLATSQRVRLVCAIGCFGVTICVSLYPQQNFLECGCPRARGPAVDDVGPRDAGANEIVLSRRGQGQAPHATRPAGPGRGAATAPANRMIMDICNLLVPRTTVRVPSDPAVLAVRCRIDREQARQTSTARTRHTRRRVFESDRVVQGVATDRSAVRRASAVALRAPRPRCRGRAPRPRCRCRSPRPRPSASRRRRPSAVASGALRPQSAGGAGPPRGHRAVGARTGPDGGIRCRACATARPTSAMSTRDTFLLKISRVSEEGYPHSGGHPDTANGSRRPPRKYMS